MKLSIQRQCDGLPDDSTCTERLELELDVPDPVNSDASKQWVTTWEKAAASLGWRRTGGSGVHRVVSVEGGKYAIPSTRAWVVCARCAELMGLGQTGDLDAVGGP